MIIIGHVADLQVKNREKNLSIPYRDGLKHLENNIKETKIPCLVIAGDLFEYCEPNDSERTLIYEFLLNISSLDTIQEIVVMAGNHDLPKFKKSQIVTEMDEDINTKENAINTFNNIISLLPYDNMKKFIYINQSKIYHSQVYPNLDYLGYSLEDNMAVDMEGYDPTHVTIPVFHAMLRDYAIQAKIPLREDILNNLKTLSIFPDNSIVLAGDIHENLHFEDSERNVRFYYPGSTQEHTHNEGDFFKFQDSEFTSQLGESKALQVYNIDDFDGNKIDIDRVQIPNYVHYITIRMSPKTAINDHLDCLLKWLQSAECRQGLDSTYIKIRCSNNMKKHELEVTNHIKSTISNAIISYDYDKVMKEVTDVSSKVVQEILEEHKSGTQEEHENIELSDINNLVLTEEELHRMFEYVSVKTLESTTSDYLKEHNIKDDLLNIFKSQLGMVIDKGRRFDIHLTNIKCNQFMALGQNDIQLDHSGIVRILGTNGIGKTTLFNMVRWVLTGTVYEGMKTSQSIKNNLVIFNKDLYNVDVVKVQLLLTVNNTPICILRTVERKWKNNTTPEQKLSKKWKSFATCSSEVKVAIHYKEENQKLLVGDNAQSNINAWFGDVIKNIMFVNSMSIDKMLKNDSDIINQMILNFIGVDYLNNLENNIDTVKEDLYVEKPKKTITQINADIMSDDMKKEQISKDRETNAQEKKSAQDLIQRYKDSLSQQRQKLLEIGDIPKMIDDKQKEIDAVQAEIDAVKPEDLMEEQYPNFTEQEPKKDEDKLNSLQSELMQKKTLQSSYTNEEQAHLSDVHKLTSEMKDVLKEKEQSYDCEMDNIEKRNLKLYEEFKNIINSIIDKFIKPSIDKMEALKKETEDSIISKSSELSTLTTDKNRLLKEIESGVCATCHRPFSDDYESHKAEKEKEIEVLTQKETTLQDEVNNLKERKKTLTTKIDDYNKSIRSCYRLSSSSNEEDINSPLELKIKDQYLSQQTSLIIISREYSDNSQKVVSMTKEQEKFTVICNKIVREEELTEEELDILSKIDLKETYDKCIDLNSKISTIQSNSKQLQDSIRLLQDSIDEINNNFNNSVVEFKRKHDEYQTKVREVDQHNKSIFEIKAKKEQNSNLLTKYTGQMTQIVSKKESYEKVQGIISSIESAIQNQETTIEGLNEKDTEFAVKLNTLATNRKQNEEMIDKALLWERNDTIFKVYSKIIKTSFRDIVFEYYRGYLNNTLDILLSDVNFKLFWDSDSQLSMISTNSTQVTYIPVNQASGMETIFSGLALIYTISILNIKHTTSHIFIDELSGQLSTGKNLSGDVKNYQELFVNILSKFNERTIFIVDHNVDDINENVVYEVTKADNGNIYFKH